MNHLYPFYPPCLRIDQTLSAEAVIDFGQLAIGDPACDLVIAWNFFNTESRAIFKEKINLDKNTWIRAMGWCLWKTLCWPVKGTPVDRILNDLYLDYAHA